MQAHTLPSSLENDGTQSPAVNYQPPPPHKAPAPIGTPLPGSLGAKSPPSKPAVGKSVATVNHPAKTVAPSQSSGIQATKQPVQSKPVQPASDRQVGLPTSNSFTPLKKTIDLLSHQTSKMAISSSSNESGPAENSPSKEDGGKQMLTKRQKTRLRKKIREQHLKEQPVANGSGRR